MIMCLLFTSAIFITKLNNFRYLNQTMRVCKKNFCLSENNIFLNITSIPWNTHISTCIQTWMCSKASFWNSEIVFWKLFRTTQQFYRNVTNDFPEMSFDDIKRWQISNEKVQWFTVKCAIFNSNSSFRFVSKVSFDEEIKSESLPILCQTKCW